MERQMADGRWQMADEAFGIDWRVAGWVFAQLIV
jgi:hypothetical protein